MRGGDRAGAKETNLLSVRVEEGLEVDNVGMRHRAHDLQLSVLRVGAKVVGEVSSSLVIAPGRVTALWMAFSPLARCRSPSERPKGRRTLNLLSWRTFLIAISSWSEDDELWSFPSSAFADPPETSLAEKTTPNDPLPTTLQLVYDRSRWLPVLPSEPTTLITLWGSSMAERAPSRSTRANKRRQYQAERPTRQDASEGCAMALTRTDVSRRRVADGGTTLSTQSMEAGWKEAMGARPGQPARLARSADGLTDGPTRRSESL